MRIITVKVNNFFSRSTKLKDKSNDCLRILVIEETY